ncbi:zinc finger BED domain-containing protein RICESLEEPER 2-like protein [Tanacetum coccineum]
MSRDLLLVQASTIASESAFSVSGRVISPGSTKLTSMAVKVCICLKDHLNSVERIQNISPLEGDMERVEEEIHVEEIAFGVAEPLDEDKIRFNQDD